MVEDWIGPRKRQHGSWRSRQAMQGVKLEVWVPTFAKVLSNIVELVVKFSFPFSRSGCCGSCCKFEDKGASANSTMVREGGSGEWGQSTPHDTLRVGRSGDVWRSGCGKVPDYRGGGGVRV